MELTPIHTVICKVASRCNLDCDYCYMYRHVDQSWRRQPAKMSHETVSQLGFRIAEHARIHDLRRVNVVLHGGEPLTLGLGYIDDFRRTISDVPGQAELSFGIQTNGTLLDNHVIDYCVKYNIAIGLSTDGNRPANDRHRLDHAGNSSHDRVEAALRLLSSQYGRRVWKGVLCVIDLENDPVETYRYFASYRPESIEFLFPLAHYDMPPAGRLENRSKTPYADWLLRVFDCWYRDRSAGIDIRRFSDIIKLLFGVSHSVSEEWGLQPVDFIVVESNGAIEAVDTLKVTESGATELGLNIFEHSFDAVYESPKVRDRQQRWGSLAKACQTCDLVKICGGGYFVHRYSSRNGFDNPSVYCADLTKLISVIAHRVGQDVAPLRTPG